MIARVSFGGGLDTQLWVGFVAVAVVVAYALAYYNIKRLQIDQHRKWMLRAWFWVSLEILRVRDHADTVQDGLDHLATPHIHGYAR